MYRHLGFGIIPEVMHIQLFPEVNHLAGFVPGEGGLHRIGIISREQVHLFAPVRDEAPL